MIFPNNSTALQAFSIAFCVVVFSPLTAGAELSSGQARKLITRMAGLELTNGAVRVRKISSTGPASAEVVADVRTVFRFEKDKQGQGRAVQIRSGPNHWEDNNLIDNALGVQPTTPECTAPDPPFKGSLVVDPSPKRVRCVLGSLLGIDVPSDAIRIQEVAAMGVPFASEPSAVVVAWIRVRARAANDKKAGWRISELRTGDHDWVKLEPVVAAVNREKEKKARTELEVIASALEQYRKDRGYYIVSDSQAVVIDHLNPKYLHQVIRLDPWHQPYKYQGERDHFTLRSTGPDSKDGTSDDIALVSRSR
jgi:hypothetical protein